MQKKEALKQFNASRMSVGWSIEKAIKTPVAKCGRKQNMNILDSIRGTPRDTIVTAVFIEFFANEAGIYTAEFQVAHIINRYKWARKKYGR